MFVLCKKKEENKLFRLIRSFGLKYISYYTVSHKHDNHAQLLHPLACYLTSSWFIKKLKGWVHCFSMQVVMNKCFHLNPEKNLAQIRLAVFEKNTKNAHFNSEKW